MVTHLFQILAFVAMEPPTALAPGAHRRTSIPNMAESLSDRALSFRRTKLRAIGSLESDVP